MSARKGTASQAVLSLTTDWREYHMMAMYTSEHAMLGSSARLSTLLSIALVLGLHTS